MKISVVIPALNEEKFIADTLESLKKQTVDVETIVVDNGSSDRTLEISRKYADLVFSYTQRKGPLFAIDYGIGQATGDIVAMAGADSLYPPKWAENVLKAFEKKSNVVGIYGPIAFFDSHPAMNVLSGFFYEFFMIITRIFKIDNTSGANFAFKRDVYLKINDFVDSWNTISEDIEVGRRIKEYGTVSLLPFNFSYTSARRFQKNGYFKSVAIFVKEWIRYKKSRGQNIKIEDYWQN